MVDQTAGGECAAGDGRAAGGEGAAGTGRAAGGEYAAGTGGWAPGTGGWAAGSGRERMGRSFRRVAGSSHPVTISPVPQSAWRAVLEADPDAVRSQAPDWVAALCEGSGYEDASQLFELAAGRQVVLPMVRRRLPHGLTIRASLPPAWGIGGLIAPGGARAEDVATVFGELAHERALRTSVTPNPLQGWMWEAARPSGAVAVPRLAHVLDLDGGFDQVWKARFTGTARTAVRKAQRSGLTVKRDTGGELVPVFFELFQRSLERWARQQHEPPALARWRAKRRDPLAKLRVMAALGQIWVAFKDAQPAAAILVLQAANAHYTRGAMDKQLAGPTRANYLLHSLAIEEACRNGCRFYHMGESGSSAPLAQFKTRFGAHPYRYFEYHLERVPLTATDRLLRTAVKRMLGFRD